MMTVTKSSESLAVDNSNRATVSSTPATSVKPTLSYLLIASDGVWDALSVQEVKSIIQSATSSAGDKPDSGSGSPKSRAAVAPVDDIEQ